MKSLSHVLKIVFAATIAAGVSVSPSPVQADDGILLGNVKLNPFVVPSYVKDSNILLDGDGAEREDDSFQIKYGVLSQFASEETFLSLDVWGNSEWFDEHDELDHTDFRDELELGINTPGGTRLTISQEYYQSEDIDYSVNALEDITINRLGVALSGYVASKLEAAVGYRFTDKEFDAAELFGWDQHLGVARLEYEYSSKSSIYLDTEAGVQDGDGNDEEGTYYKSVLGLTTKQTAKITGSAGVGVMGLDSDADDFTEAALEAELQWVPSKSFVAQLGVEKTIQPASIARNNYDVLTSVKMVLGAKVLDSLLATLTGVYREVDLRNAIDSGSGLEKKDDDVYELGLRLEYQPTTSLVRFFVEGEYREQDSTLNALDFEQTVFTAGVHLQY